MKTTNKLFYSLFALTAGILFAAPVSAAGPGQIRFIKGNIADKTAAVKDAAADEAAVLSMAAVDFCLEQSAVLGNDRELSALALAGVLTLPDSIDGSQIYTKLYDLYKAFTDNTARVAIIEKLVHLYKKTPAPNTIAFLKNIVEASVSSGPVSDVEKTAAEALGTIGDGAAFTILYNCYLTDQWQSEHAVLSASLEKLADKSLPELMEIISKDGTENLSTLFNLIENSASLSASFKSEVAEHILSELLYSSETAGRITDDLLKLEVDCVHVISKNNWTRASALVLKYFSQVKEFYKNNRVSEQHFLDAVSATAMLASSDAAKALALYLGELNTQMEQGTAPSKTVVLAVINALGTLGNKTAFDYLLYATYLEYSDEVVTAARNALTKLKW